jgi:tetratricopeptide (TPR) repeat protein
VEGTKFCPECGQEIAPNQGKMKLLKGFFAASHINRGAALANKGLYDEAIEEYRKAVHLKPDLADVHCLLGAALHCKGVVDGAKDLVAEAIRECEAALMLNPDIAEAHCTMGRALFDKGLVDEAIKEHREALWLNPDFPEVHFDLGIFLASKGLIDEGLAETREALRLKPGFVDAHYNDVFYSAHTGLIHEAVKKIKEGTTQSIDDLANSRLARKTMKVSDKPDEDFSTHLLALNPHDGSGPFAVRAVNSAEMSLPAVTTDGRISYLPGGSDLEGYNRLLADVRREVMQLSEDIVSYVCVAISFLKQDTFLGERVLIYKVVGFPKRIEQLELIYESLANLRVVGDADYIRTEKFLQSEPMKSWINPFLENLKKALDWSEEVRHTLDSHEKQNT